MSFASYLAKVKPLTLRPDAQDDRQATAAEVRQLRGLLGALQWPATQGCPHLSCSVSMLQGSVSTAQVRHLKEANKLLRFAKSMKDVSLKFHSFAGIILTWDDVGFLGLSDAAWATRPDGSSQGGYLQMLVPRTSFDDKEFDYSVLDWRSYKLRRISRSSLNAETQAAADAADALEYVKVFWNLIHYPKCDVLDPMLRTHAPSALVVDAKSLYDTV